MDQQEKTSFIVSILEPLKTEWLLLNANHAVSSSQALMSIIGVPELSQWGKRIRINFRL
jgi:hypothetical protein